MHSLRKIFLIVLVWVLYFC